jgi:hypothetical protein
MKVYKKDGKFFMEDEQNVVQLTPNDDYYLKLPNNSVNRIWVSCKKIDAAPLQCVDYGSEVKVARVIGPRQENSKKLIDYATDEEKKLIEGIMEKCKERKNAEKKVPMSELEKAKAKAEMWAAKVAKLKAQTTEGK